ncbi:sugar phosphate isomerase/epimerase [Acidipropionibacterium acidipropionici]|uniref:AP endonuclease n=1 Tax=Acidipropionibacterium acidipropionici TaxID=1748 RepID=A0AAC9AN90_9ACTN|nr:sugar phosphate isomerase/epimerase family protein [Acidipropionibacterium acidipropionici]AMS05262.1 AP endonuclease [Acidipropionibacterium acidipropionici]AOZ46743.1 AP endonuclease [Acidipropionibacterium acidipropionici]AZP37185.1 sugar phosphate isomerase/epimerase [Acidipropionibacterium acidipropionici]
MTLSTSSMYPESTASTFECASELGYDGVEVMVGMDQVSADLDQVEALSHYHEMPVTSVHAPCLLVTPNVWGTDPWGKLDRSGEAARRFGSRVIVVHPPFRWQRDYSSAFEAGIARLNADERNRAAGVIYAVENMYPWRTPAGKFLAYAPDWDPTLRSYDHLTLDLSHASTGRMEALDYVRAWGRRLAHIHLTDGSGSFKDEHLLPGEGDQRSFEVVREAVAHGFNGDVVLEVNTRRFASRSDRQDALGHCLEGTRDAVAEGMASRTGARAMSGSK